MVKRIRQASLNLLDPSQSQATTTIVLYLCTHIARVTWMTPMAVSITVKAWHIEGEAVIAYRQLGGETGRGTLDRSFMPFGLAAIVIDCPCGRR